MPTIRLLFGSQKWKQSKPPFATVLHKNVQQKLSACKFIQIYSLVATIHFELDIFFLWFSLKTILGL